MDPEARRTEYWTDMAEADNAAYPNETNRLGKVVILSKYPDIKIAYKAVSGGFRKAKEKAYVKGDVFLILQFFKQTLGVF